MKNIKKRNSMIDAMAEARKSKNFKIYSENAEVRMRFGIEVYDARGKQGISQQKLAKNIHSTQKVISKIENGDVNVGIELLNRISKNLGFCSNNFAEIFGCPSLTELVFIRGGESEISNIDMKKSGDNFICKINSETNTNTIKSKQTL